MTGKEITRYNGVEEDPIGAYVLYDDHRAALVDACRELEREVERLKAQVDFYEKR